MILMNLEVLNSGTLLEQLQQTATEKGILIESDAPEAELHNCQSKMDALAQECLRRMSW